MNFPPQSLDLSNTPLKMGEGDIKEVQTQLAAMGFYHGKIDGWLSTLTWKAVQFWQTYLGKEADGDLKLDELDELLPPPPPEAPEPPPSPPADANPIAARPIWPTQSQRRQFYGVPGQNLKKLILPFPVKLAWDLGEEIQSFSVHKAVHESASRAFWQISRDYSEKERADLGINLFGGCFNNRLMRGSKTTLSDHAWAVAIDFDPARNQLRWGRDKARLAHPDAEKFWQAWENEGWVSLGRAENRDYMHCAAVRR